jgi:hypothetical protein
MCPICHRANFLPMLPASSARNHFLFAQGFSESVHFFCEAPFRESICYAVTTQEPNSGLGRLVEVSRSHAIRHTHTHTHTPGRTPPNE